MKEVGTITIEGLEFVFRPNFEGRAEKYNAEGNRYFNAKIPENMVEPLLRDGWNVKMTKPGRNHPNPEEHVPEAYLEVSVGFNYRPPLIVFIRDGRQTPIGENLVSLIDSTEFENIDVVIRPYEWENSKGKGIKAYLKKFYGTVEMDDLDRKYAPLPPTDNGSDEEEPPWRED